MKEKHTDVQQQSSSVFSSPDKKYTWGDCERLKTYWCTVQAVGKVEQSNRRKPIFTQNVNWFHSLVIQNWICSCCTDSAHYKQTLPVITVFLYVVTIALLGLRIQRRLREPALLMPPTFSRDTGHGDPWPQMHARISTIQKQKHASTQSLQNWKIFVDNVFELFLYRLFQIIIISFYIV